MFNEVTYVQSPIPTNPYDCGLFSLGIYLHLLRGIHIQDNIFSQKEITALRNGLCIVVNGPISQLGLNPRKVIPQDFINSFFDMTYHPSQNKNMFLTYLHKITNYISPIKKNKMRLQIQKTNLELHLTIYLVPYKLLRRKPITCLQKCLFTVTMLMAIPVISMI